MISVVPRRRCDMASDLTTSSVTAPPALRRMCASPSFSPRAAKMSSRESIQATIASRRTGRISIWRWPWRAVNATLFATSSSITSTAENDIEVVSALLAPGSNPLHAAFTIGRPLGIAVVHKQHELPGPVRRRVRAVAAIDVHAGHDGCVGEAKPPLVAVPLVEPERLAGLESGGAVHVRTAIRRLGPHVAALRVL